MNICDGLGWEAIYLYISKVSNERASLRFGSVRCGRKSPQFCNVDLAVKRGRLNVSSFVRFPHLQLHELMIIYSPFSFVHILDASYISITNALMIHKIFYILFIFYLTYLNKSPPASTLNFSRCCTLCATQPRWLMSSLPHDGLSSIGCRRERDTA